ncbi:hypothetical protein LXL04_015236 [Taraxacum kok-saghyz]
MAVEAVVSVVLQKLSDMLKGESLTQNKVIVYEVQGMMKSLNSMRGLISSKDINQRADGYLDAIYNMEDKIEKFTLIVSCRRKVFGLLGNHIFIFNNINSCHKIHHKIKKITVKLMKQRDKTDVGGTKLELLMKQGSFSISETQATTPGGLEELSFNYSCNEEEIQIVGIKQRFQQTRRLSSFSYIEEELGIFGRNEDVDTLMNKLTDINSGHVVSILGQSGIGKTTLARTIYKSKEIKRHFQFRAWVSVLDKYTAKDILQILFKATYKVADIDDDENSTKMKLSSYFKSKRYLVILDGVGSSNIWEDIKEALPDENNGSKLVLTSSQITETPKMSIFSHHMVPLDDEDSWKAFREKVGKEKRWDLVSEKSKRAILWSCKGLPLNINLLAGFFSMKDPSSWSEFIVCQRNSVNILSLCYNDLSDNLKVCLLYSVLFPKDFDIPVRRLLRLWLAEGFVTQNSTNGFPEDNAQTYFEELVNRNMIQISKLRSDNSPRRCRVVGVLHDYLLPKARETNLFHNYRNLINCKEICSCNVRRMVEYEGLNPEQGNSTREIIDKESIPSSTTKIELKKSFFNPSHLRSYMSFNHQRDYRHAKRIGNILGDIISEGFGLLRVLDLEGVYKPILPENLGNLSNLRYLGLRSTYLDTLPESVGELTHLETLDLKHTCIDELPRSVWRLKKLYYLNLNEMYLNMHPQSSLRLWTLWGLSLDEKVPIKNGLDKMNSLRELGITFNLSSNQDDLMDWISKLTELRSLRLRSKDSSGSPSKLMIKSMSDLGQLSHLNLLGNLEKLPDVIEFPPTLKVLTLSISLLTEDPLELLGQLPCLTVLRLLGQSYIGKEMVSRKGGFSKLKVLKMWMLKDLESWIVETESMQSLKHLEIRCCDNLHNIPSTLLQQQQLEHVVLTGMTCIFTTEVERLKSDHTSITINPLEFPTLPVSL